MQENYHICNDIDNNNHNTYSHHKLVVEQYPQKNVVI